MSYIFLNKISFLRPSVAPNLSPQVTSISVALLYSIYFNSTSNSSLKIVGPLLYVESIYAENCEIQFLRGFGHFY